MASNRIHGMLMPATVYNRALLNVSKAVTAVAMIIIVKPEACKSNLRVQFPEFSAVLFHLVHYGPLVLIAVSSYLADRATKGTWWRKNRIID
jgi:hypothetical protein